MWQAYCRKGPGNFKRQWRFDERERTQCVSQPSREIIGRFDATLATEQERFPNADGGQPKLVFSIIQLVGYPPGQALRFGQTPKPNVGVQK